MQVYKLISKNSIDVAMLKIQQKKLELGEDVSGVNDGNDEFLIFDSNTVYLANFKLDLSLPLKL